MTFFLFLLSNSDKKKMVDGKLKCMIGGDKKEGREWNREGKGECGEAAERSEVKEGR